ncbi:hypothetical protein N7519_011005 [Penicillium mononematosum]|uniref:uncharacterized protein n=1 Tax=Penicillium mononematosum TaxID=268346 RepID=UPI0025485B4E|nr:uncharacterized protein N7519_011005 [Penicillium mononematosum]KAJ6180544.1 hypothetical protein N7519_011005 [Penicillium mononematosum]
MSILSEPNVTEETSDVQTQQRSKHKKSKLLPDESDEGITAESSESETNDFRSKGHRQNPKHKCYANHKGKGKKMPLDSESEDERSEVEDDESSVANFKLPSKTQRKTTKQKTTKHKGHTKHSTSYGARKGRDSPFHTSTKSSSSRASRQNILHKRGLKRGRNLHDYEPGLTEESTVESSSAEMDGSSSRACHGRSKRKRLGKPRGLADTSDNDSDMEEEIGRRSARTYAITTPAKTRAQNGNPKKIDKTNELAESTDKDLVGGAMDGLTLEGDALKTAGRAAKATKHDGRGHSVYEENWEPEEPKEAHSHHA